MSLWLCLFAWVTSSCYSVKQAWLFSNLYFSKKPVEEVKNTASVALREKLELTQEILLFAQAQGLNVGESYQTFINTPESAVSFWVQASKADKLEAYTWWFPVVGSVPYIAFFDRADRDELAEKLRLDGLDVAVGRVAAFSSLGWFDDPIFDSMLARPDEELAHLLFHELTHRTFWVSSEVSFNENLAEYVAMELVNKFFSNRPEVLEIYYKRRFDRGLFSRWLFDLKTALDRLYSKPYDEQKLLLEEKENLFNVFVNERLPDFQTDSYSWLRQRNWNNAYVIGAGLYEPKLSVFEQAYECLSVETFGEFLKALKLHLKGADDPFSRLSSICED